MRPNRRRSRRFLGMISKKCDPDSLSPLETTCRDLDHPEVWHATNRGTTRRSCRACREGPTDWLDSSLLWQLASVIVRPRRHCRVCGGSLPACCSTCHQMKLPSLFRPGRRIPMRFRGQPKHPLLWYFAGRPDYLGQFPTEPIRLGVIDVINRQIISLAPAGVRSPGSFSINRFHRPCVTSYLPIQKPAVSVTST